MSKFGEHLHGGVITPQEIERVREVLLFEDPERTRKLTRFFILLILATAIATFGLLADSVATVIGAMIVAPLMLPIMGVAFGVGLGDRDIILSSLLVSILGIATAILLGFVLTWGIRNLIYVESNTQIITRTAPRLVDLCAALATGLAGAFAMGRRDVSDTLPGVAIAISLVPPLANVGILLAVGRTDLAIGSLLLFVTNYLAILLTGAFMFSLMGYPSVHHTGHSRRAKHTAIAVAAVLLALIIVPLTATTYGVVQDSLVEQRAAIATREWLEGSDYQLVAVNSGNDAVRIIISGAGTLPPETILQDALRGRLFQLPVIMDIVPQTQSRFESAQVGAP